MMPASRKTVLITGCSQGGIGHALAEEFHLKGLTVFATARRLDAMTELKKLGIMTMPLDVTDIQAVRNVRDEIASLTGGKLDILVNNATFERQSGVGYPVAVSDFSMPDVRALFEVNLFAPMVIVQEFVHLLIASGNGCIVQTGSISGIVPVPFSAAYNASKAALHAFSNSIRVELAPFNIKVLNVVTGAVRSNITKPWNLPNDSLYKPMESLYQERRINASQKNAMPADRYAVKVVAEALKLHPRAWLWAGNKIYIVWLVDTFLGRKVFDWIMNRMFGLSEFSAMVKENKDKAV